ncbi:hypothetical protein N8I71_04955 [Roseibacterium sp. SDUM158016]|uniref:hypothetical protein n=1 Tax=Roseicyclus sediminis TaxID=2980997 RepID=UPI0021D1BEFE|nr:hypothetical protein [Roseibacterium sp. SDUM158016]MCU4652166.1 hypothetical protein [Roseibacterium sp. SDUM158016]
MRILAAILPALVALPVQSQGFDTRPGDATIAARDLDDRLRGREIVFFDDGVSHFYNDGRYTFAYDLGRGGYAYGYFEVTDDSTVCVAYLNGFSRCDGYVENAGRLVMVTGDGLRFPIREERDAGPDPAME